jgi:hypothetical protein
MKHILILSFLCLQVFSCQNTEKVIRVVDKAKHPLDKPFGGDNDAHNNFGVGQNGSDSEVYHFRRSDTVLTIYNLSKSTSNKLHLRNIAKMCCTDNRAIDRRFLSAACISEKKWFGIGFYDSQQPVKDGIVYTDLEGKPILTVQSDSNEIIPGYKYSYIFPIQSNDLYDSSILLSFYPAGHPLEHQYKRSPIWMYHLGTRKLRESFVQYPNDYLIEGKYFFHTKSLSLTVVEDLLVVSYYYNDSLFLYKDKTLFKKVLARSRYIDKFEHQNNDSAKISFSYVMNYHIKMPKFTAVTYDPYRKKIYRLARHAQPLFNADKTANKIENANFSILVFDSDFNFEGEVMIGSGYSDRFLGCLPEGIVLIKMKDGRNKSSIVIKEIIIE